MDPFPPVGEGEEGRGGEEGRESREGTGGEERMEGRKGREEGIGKRSGRKARRRGGMGGEPGEVIIQS